MLTVRAAESFKHRRLADIVQAGEKLRELEPKTKQNLYNAGCAYALSLTLIVQGSSSLSAAEQAERDKLTALSLTCLKEALALGYDEFEHMRKDNDLKSLRDLPEFDALFPKNSESRPLPPKPGVKE